MPSTCAGAYVHISWELFTSCSSIYSHKLDPLSVLGLALFGMIMSKEVLLILCTSSTTKFKHFFGHYNTYTLTMLKVWTYPIIIVIIIIILYNWCMHVFASYFCTRLCARECVSFSSGILKGFPRPRTQWWKTYSSLSTAILMMKHPKKRTCWRGRGSQAAAPKVPGSLQTKSRHHRQTARPFDVIDIYIYYIIYNLHVYIYIYTIYIYIYIIHSIIILYEEEWLASTACHCLEILDWIRLQVVTVCIS